MATTLIDTDNYRLRSFGAGVIYAIEHKDSGWCKVIERQRDKESLMVALNRLASHEQDNLFAALHKMGGTEG